ncbi:DUF362 domain-containing protein [Candidatus Bathyarchaeota archaeon]|nr:DUF362 domain-containing protein [Candidatus Bathyarchaeota archaeon]
MADYNSVHANYVRAVDNVSISITAINGIIAGEVYETSGKPVKMDLVIAGVDPVAVDAVGAAVMGISSREVKHLVLAEKKGLGTCNLEKIEVVGEKIENVRRKFRRSILSKFLQCFL